MRGSRSIRTVIQKVLISMKTSSRWVRDYKWHFGLNCLKDTARAKRSLNKERHTAEVHIPILQFRDGAEFTYRKTSGKISHSNDTICLLVDLLRNEYICESICSTRSRYWFAILITASMLLTHLMRMSLWVFSDEGAISINLSNGF